MLRTPRYLLFSIISAVVMGVVYVVTQVIFIVQNIDIWFSVISPLNLILFLLFSSLFGITLSYQIWVRKQPQVCNMKKGASMSGGSTFFTFLVVQCPACASIGALFLPVSVLGFFTQYSTLITLITIGLLVFTLRYLGAFKK